ncbi:MAG: class I SAM-dependent methyltransferase [Candidatus Diapherotrites archaeon]|uniref:Class I SAM-dependent methyltransferase n=1 Tax=Candidatus Iainarchaeum sp. TaxID=3101447 RepID=A0A8T3YMY8_9ARCH|nr:class I SAM-dependent methyltransferase [Candidatus Diapherotrites archaeon]
MPGLSSNQPSSTVVAFAEFLASQGFLPPKRVVDIGCGVGRNSMYLAGLGFEVHAMDYIRQAVSSLAEKAGAGGLREMVNVIEAPIDSTWPFAGGFFDAAVDCFSSIDIETLSGRQVCRGEMFRTLKPGGYAMVAVVSSSDEFEREMSVRSPGAEKNSVIWPNGKFQKNYVKGELEGFYSCFKILRLFEVKKPAYKLGRHYTATNLVCYLRKE